MVEMEKLNLKELVLPDYNPRQITDEAFESLKTSIKEFGYVTPLVVNTVNNHVVGGNQRVKALIELGYTTVECAIVEIKDINEEKALNIRLNNNSGDWDIGKLDNIFNDLNLAGFDATLTGFNTENLQPFESSKTTEIPTSETITSEIPIKNETTIERGINRTDPDYKEPTHEIKEDNYKDENITVNVKTGDLYRLGNHYLLCGDCTIPENYNKLTNGQEMDLCFTDPPYGMKKEKDGIHNDNLNYDELLEFNKIWIPLTFKALKSNGSWYCWGIDQPLMDIYAFILKPMIRNKEISFRNLITWDKGTGIGQKSPELRCYAKADEKCLFVMKGSESCQGFSVNAEDYSENMDKVRTYLENEINKLHKKGLNDKKIANALGYKDGRTVNHWYSKSQFALPTKENYESLREYGRRILKQDYDFLKQDYDFLKQDYDFLKQDYDELKQDYDELKQDFYSKRSYFNNTHDNMNNVWHFKRAIYTDDKVDHSTPKPIQLCSRAILSSSRENENVLDVFGGSGSTLIACEQLNRNCYMMELAPYYCQVIINRWEKLTGETAVKIN